MRYLTLTLSMAVMLSGCSVVVDRFDFVDGTDAAVPDADVPDAEVPDGGVPDAEAPDAGPECAASEMLCGAVCVDLLTSTEHCGACDAACDPGYICREGSCYDPPVEVAAGGGHSCVRRGSGRVFCWGYNASGELGRGDFVPGLDPTPGAVVALSDAASLSAAGTMDRFLVPHLGITCVHHLDGTASCWGHNMDTQVGDQTMENRASPTMVLRLTGVVDVGVGIDGGCALREFGDVRCWGLLRGAGTTTYIGDPASPIGAVGRMTQLAVANEHACALEEGGAVWCWGSNIFGDLGDGTTTPRTTAERVLGIPAAVEVAVSYAGPTCARESSGQVWCWGLEDRVGTGSTTSEPTVPVEVTGLPDATAIFGGPISPSVYATRPDGTLWEVGVTASPPSIVEGISDVRQIARGPFHMCVITNSNELMCQGFNRTGQVGDGTTVNATVFVPVALPD